MLKLLKKLFTRVPSRSLAVLFLEYDRDQCGGSAQVFTTLQHYLSTIPDCQVTYLRIDNRNEGTELQQLGDRLYQIGGDNRFHEFSGWQKGIEHLNRLGSTFQALLLVNDMFLKPGESFLKEHATECLDTCLAKQAVVGRIDYTGEHYTAADLDVSQWVCTNCFFVPHCALAALKEIVSVKEDLDDYLPATFPASGNRPPSAFFTESAPLNDTYKSWLIEWLTQRWHSRFELSETTWPLLRTKVRNILNESLLTARFREAGFPAIEIGKKKY